MVHNYNVKYGNSGTLGIPQYLVPKVLEKYPINKQLLKKIHELLVI